MKLLKNFMEALLDVLSGSIVLFAFCWSVHLTSVFVFTRFADKLTSDDMAAMLAALVLTVILAALKVLNWREKK